MADQRTEVVRTRAEESASSYKEVSDGVIRREICGTLRRRTCVMIRNIAPTSPQGRTYTRLFLVGGMVSRVRLMKPYVNIYPFKER